MATDYKLRITAQDKSKKGFNSVNKNINSTQSAMKKLAGAFAGVFAVRQIVEFGKETLALADTIGKVADSIGVQTEFLQRYQFAAQQSGLTTEEFNKGMQNFTKMVGQAQLRTSEAGRTLEKLGVQVKNADGSVKGAEEVFIELMTALDGVGSQFEKNAILADLMGRAGVKLAVMGKDGAEAMKELAASATGVIPEQTIRDAERFNDAMNRLQRQVLTPLRNELIEVATAFLDVAEAMGLVDPEPYTKSIEEQNQQFKNSQQLIKAMMNTLRKNKELTEEQRKTIKQQLTEEIKLRDEAAEAIRKYNEVEEAKKIFTGSVDASNELNNSIKENITVVKQFADTVEGELTRAFTDFFDNTSQQFLDFKDLATSITRAVINELIQVFIVQKLVQGITTGISNIGAIIKSGGLGDIVDGIQNLDGGGYTGNGIRAGGLDGRGGRLAMIHPQETVIDHTKGQAIQSAPTVNFNISTVDAAGFDQLLASRKGLITSIINNAMNNQGKMGVV
jgi:hypothetical protein